jgi:uncharacterized membrane protein YdbT with pleckstrin-like domain
MKYIKSILNPGEQVLRGSEYSKTAMTVTQVVFGIITVSAGLMGGVSAFISLAVISGIIYLLFWLGTLGFENAVTNQRVILKRGIFGREVLEIPLKKIESVECSQGLIERLLDYGTVKVSGSGNTSVSIGIIDNPVAFRQFIAQQIA